MATLNKRTPRKQTESPKPHEDTPQRPAPSPQPAVPRVPEGVPHIYADLAMDAVYGIHTTKIVLGEETGDGAGGLRPVGVVVLPTATLLDLSRRVVTDLTQPGIAQETAKRFAGILRSMQPDAPEKSD